MPERKPVEAKIMACGLLNPRDHTRVPAPLMGVLVRQLHATSDFTDVRDMSLPLDIMRSSRHYDAKSKQTYKSSVLLSTGKSGWRLTGYDKHAETVARRQGVLAPRGTFRFEAKLMSNVLRTERLTHLPDLTADRINRVFLKGFVKAGLDRAYGGQSPLRRHRLPGMSRFMTTQLYLRLDARAAGEDWTPQDQATERGYATRAARHGFVFGRGSRERLGPHRHLDPVDGRERPPTTAWMESTRPRGGSQQRPAAEWPRRAYQPRRELFPIPRGRTMRLILEVTRHARGRAPGVGEGSPPCRARPAGPAGKPLVATTHLAHRKLEPGLLVAPSCAHPSWTNPPTSVTGPLRPARRAGT